MTTSPAPFDLEVAVARAVAISSMVPFGGRRQRRTAAAVMNALRANRVASLLALGWASIKYGIRRDSASEPATFRWALGRAENYVADNRQRGFPHGHISIVSCLDEAFGV